MRGGQNIAEKRLTWRWLVPFFNSVFQTDEYNQKLSRGAEAAPLTLVPSYYQHQYYN